MLGNLLLSGLNPSANIEAFTHDFETGDVSVPLALDETTVKSVRVPIGKCDPKETPEDEIWDRMTLGESLLNYGVIPAMAEPPSKMAEKPTIVGAYKIYQEPRGQTEPGWVADSDEAGRFVSVHNMALNPQITMANIVTGQQLTRGAWVYASSVIVLEMLHEPQKQIITGALILESWLDHFAITLPRTSTLSPAEASKIFQTLKTHGWLDSADYHVEADSGMYVSTQKLPDQRRDAADVSFANGKITIIMRNPESSTRGLKETLIKEIIEVMSDAE